MGGSKKSSRREVVSSLHFAAHNQRLTDCAYGIILGMKRKNHVLDKMDLSTSLEMTGGGVEMTGGAVGMTAGGVGMTGEGVEMAGVAL